MSGGKQYRLSDREVEVLEGTAAGLTALQIAQAIGISVDTVKTHLKRVYDFLGVRSASHAIVVAHEMGYLPLDCGAPGHDHAKTSPQDNRVDRIAHPFTQVNNRSRKRKPLPEGLAERFPSIRWGEDEWFHAFQRDEDLYFRLLGGIAKAVGHTRGQAPAKRSA